MICLPRNVAFPVTPSSFWLYKPETRNHSWHFPFPWVPHPTYQFLSTLRPSTIPTTCFYSPYCKFTVISLQLLIPSQLVSLCIPSRQSPTHSAPEAEQFFHDFPLFQNKDQNPFLGLKSYIVQPLHPCLFSLISYHAGLPAVFFPSFSAQLSPCLPLDLSSVVSFDTHNQVKSTYFNMLFTFKIFHVIDYSTNVHLLHQTFSSMRKELGFCLLLYAHTQCGIWYIVRAQ